MPFPGSFSEPSMTDRELALVLPTDTEAELLGQDGKAAWGYAERSLAEGTRLRTAQTSLCSSAGVMPGTLQQYPPAPR